MNPTILDKIVDVLSKFNRSHAPIRATKLTVGTIEYKYLEEISWYGDFASLPGKNHGDGFDLLEKHYKVKVVKSVRKSLIKAQ